MSVSFAPCGSCDRHVKEGDAACPAVPVPSLDAGSDGPPEAATGQPVDGALQPDG
jgi:hypothetical protein